MTRLLFPLIIMVILVGLGCNDHGTSPVVPGLGDPDISNELTSDRHGTSSRILWGMYGITIHGDPAEVEIVPLRTAMFNGNVTHFLAPPYSPVNNIKIQLLPDCDFPNGYVHVDVTLTHPFPGANEYKGFDTRGIFMADATFPSQHDPDIIYGMVSNNEAQLLNADGLTRWWNATEFTDLLPLLSFKPGPSGTDTLPSATVNGYRYFADDLTYEGSVAEMTTANRGVFTPGVSGHRRDYQIQFPVGGPPGFYFNYAVETSWELPDTLYAPDYPPANYPPGAQAQEAYNIVIDTMATTAYFNTYDTGGDVIIAAEIFDWQSLINPGGIVGEVSAIWAESPVFNQPVNLTGISSVTPGSQPTSGIFRAVIDNSQLNLSAAGTFPLFLSVESTNPNSYMPQVDGGENFVFPDGPLAAYAHGTVVIGNGDLPTFTVISPNGGEIWDESSSHEITWSGGVGIPDVEILYSKDNFVSDFNTIAVSTPNDGSFTWDPVPNDPSSTVKVRVQDATDPGISDNSDNNFTILSETIVVLIPNGGETFIVDSSENIKWTGGAGVANVTLSYSKDNFASDINVIATDVVNDGAYLWSPVPNDPSVTVKIRIEDSIDPLNFDDSDDYFTISDQCTFSSAHTFNNYADAGAVTATGFHFMSMDSSRVVTGRPDEYDLDNYSYLAMYNKTNLTAPIDIFQVPGHVYPDRPFNHEVDSMDRIYFIMAPDLNGTGYQGPTFTDVHYIDWDGNQFVTSSYQNFSISSFLDGGEYGVEIFVDTLNYLHVLTNQGKVIKFDHTNSYTGSEVFDMDGVSGYPEDLEIDFLYSVEDNSYFIYTANGTYKRALYKVAPDGTILTTLTDIFYGLTDCGTSTGAIDYDGDCRIVAIDGHAMDYYAVLRYNLALNQVASSVETVVPIFNHPGNSINFNTDGTILFNSYFWQDKTFLITYYPPTDW